MGEGGRRATWDRPWSTVYRDDRPGGSWFPDGVLNASVNCLDRHLPQRADQVAIYWEGEIGDRRTITYGALHAEVVSFAEALRGLGVGRGDRVALHLGWLPETVVAMLACARLGALHGCCRHRCRPTPWRTASPISPPRSSSPRTAPCATA